MTDDLDLLGRYARSRTPAVFTEIVRRHVDPACSVTLRQVRLRLRWFGRTALAPCFLLLASYFSVMRILKSFFLAALVLIIFVVGVWLGFTVRYWLKSGSGLREENTATVVEQVQTLSDLVTVKYVLEKVVILEDAKWYGENRVLLLAHGIVKAGMDLKRITPDDVTIAGKKISLRLPMPRITDAYLDDAKSQVIDHTTGLLRMFDKDLEQAARANAVDDIRRAARMDGILDEADKRARLELELFLRQAGFEQVQFR